jgi:hypothetical protein
MNRSGDQSRGDAWVRRGCALVVAGVAAYSSYAHQRHFALAGGADQVSAALWPLSVDGLVILASLGLVQAQAQATLRAQLALWLAFLLGVAVSLAANIAAAPTLSWQPVLVAEWPPLALLLAVGARRALSQPRHDPHRPDRGPRPHRLLSQNPRLMRSRVPRARRLPRAIGEHTRAR